MHEFLSIIVPFFNAESTILPFLESLIVQKEKDSFEVLLIDNSSKDNTVTLIEDFCSVHKNINITVLSYTAKQSSYAARNFGTNHAKGSIYAFTDADCILMNDYSTKIFDFFNRTQEKDVVVSGRIELLLDDKRNVWENFDKSCFLDNERAFSDNKIATANMIVRKESFQKVGDFLEIKSTGDSEWAQRSVSSGCRIEYMPTICVYHPTRKTFNEVVTKFSRIGYGYGQRWQRGILLLTILYFLRIFNYRTNLKISGIIYPNVGLIGILKFNWGFHILRWFQLSSAIKGYYARVA